MPQLSPDVVPQFYAAYEDDLAKLAHLHMHNQGNPRLGYST